MRWPLNFVLELGHRNSADAVRLFAEFKNDLGPGDQAAIGTISFDYKKTCLPLAIADALVYSTFRYTQPPAINMAESVALKSSGTTPITHIPINKEVLDGLRETALAIHMKAKK